MESKKSAAVPPAKLTGIERELVLQYLIDGNVPVTVTPIEAEENEQQPDGGKVKPASSAIFPIAIKAEQLKVLKQGIILLTNPPENARNFIGKKARVEFYFNRLGLYFETQLKETKSALALIIPSSISRITESHEAARQADFSAEIYYCTAQSSGNLSAKAQAAAQTIPDGSVSIECFPAQGYHLFSKPAWKDIPEIMQKKAKSYLESFIAHARKQGVAGSGVQLIPVVRYLAEKIVKMESVEGRKNPLDILFVDHERIVFGAKTNSMDLKEGNEYALEMSFPLPHAVRKDFAARKIFAACKVETNYTDDENLLTCAVCRYTSMQEEDLRFLYEKCTNQKFV